MGGVGKYISWVIYLLAEQARWDWHLGGADIYLWAERAYYKSQDYFIDLVAEWDGLELFYLLMSRAGQ